MSTLFKRVGKELRAYWQSLAQISRNARLYLLASTLMAIGMGAQLVLYNLYLFELGYQEDVVGQVAAAVALGVALGGVPAGRLYDYFGGRVTFAIAVLGTSVSMLFRTLTGDPLWLMVWAALNGLANSLYFVSIFPFITEHSSPVERAHVYGLNQAVWTGFMILGSFCSGYLPGLFQAGWSGLSLIDAQRLTLLSGVLLGLAALVPVGLIHGQRPESGQAVPRRWLPASASARAIINGALVLTLSGAVVGLTQPFYNVYFKRIFLMDTEMIATVISISQMMGLISALLVPLAVRQWGLATASALLTLLGAPLLLAMGLPLPAAVVVATFLLRVGLETLALAPMMNLVMEIVPSGDRGAMSGVRLITNYGAQALAGAAGGWLVVTTGYIWLFALAAAVQLITGGLLWYLFRVRRPVLETT